MKSIIGHELKENTSNGSWLSSQHQPIQSDLILPKGKAKTVVCLNSRIPFYLSQLLFSLSRDGSRRCLRLYNPLTVHIELNYSMSAGRDR